MAGQELLQGRKGQDCEDDEEDFVGGELAGERLARQVQVCGDGVQQEGTPEVDPVPVRHEGCEKPDCGGCGDRRGQKGGGACPAQEGEEEGGRQQGQEGRCGSAGEEAENVLEGAQQQGEQCEGQDEGGAVDGLRELWHGLSDLWGSWHIEGINVPLDEQEHFEGERGQRDR